MKKQDVLKMIRWVIYLRKIGAVEQDDFTINLTAFVRQGQANIDYINNLK